MVAVEHDEAGAGAHDGHSQQDGVADGLEKGFVADDAGHGSTFTARDDESAVGLGDIGTILLPVGQIADFERFVANAPQHLFVLDERALKG